MANFATHAAGGLVAGGLSAFLSVSVFGLEHWAFAGASAIAGFVGSMVPDIDHDEAIPIREVFGILAALVPGMALPWLTRNYFDTETAICFFAAAYCGIRFVVAPIFKHFTVHRGIFHSIPAIVVAGEAVALGLVGLGPRERVIIGASVVLGALTHLVLDEVFAVNFLGMKMKKSFGTAIKLWAPSLPATLACYAALAVLSWQLWSRVGHKLPWF